MRKYICAILVAVLSLSLLTGCGKNINDNFSSATSSLSDPSSQTINYALFFPETEYKPHPELVRYYLEAELNNDWVKQVNASEHINNDVYHSFEYFPHENWKVRSDDVLGSLAADYAGLGDLFDYYYPFLTSIPPDYVPPPCADSSLPEIYWIIQTLNIPKESFIKANNYSRELSLSSPPQDDPTYFTDEEIELLYSGNTEAVCKYFMEDHYGFIHNGKLYSTGYIYQWGDPRKLKEDRVSLDELKNLCKILEERDAKLILSSNTLSENAKRIYIWQTYKIVKLVWEYEKYLEIQ